MKDIHYAYCVARLRSREKYMLSDSTLTKLCEMKSVQEAVNELISLGWIEEKGSINSYIKAQSDKLWTLLSESVPDKKELDLLCVLNDFFNIKAAVKCHFTSVCPKDYYITPTSLDLEKLTENVASHSFRSIGGKMGESAKEAYETALVTENGQLAEIIIDRAALECLCDYAKSKKTSLTNDVCGFLCDTANIKTALRINAIKKNPDFASSAIGECVKLRREDLLKFSLSGEEELYSFLAKTPYAKGVEEYKKGSIHYEKWCDENLYKLLSKAKYTSFGFDPICSYYYRKTGEIKNVRLILSALSVGKSAEEIKERVSTVNA